MPSALAAALALALAVGAGGPSAADPGGVHGHDGAGPPIALPGVPPLPGHGDGGPTNGDGHGPPPALAPPVAPSPGAPVGPVIGPPIPGPPDSEHDRGPDLGVGRGADPPGLARGHDRGRDGRDLPERAEDAVSRAIGKAQGEVDGEVEGARGQTGEAAEAAAEAEVTALMQARAKAAQALIVTHRDVIAADNLGRPIVRGEILALAPTPAALARAQRIGFRIRSRESFAELGIDSVVLTTPPRMSAVAALQRLRAMDPAGQYDFNHVFQESGRVGRRLPALPNRMAQSPQVASDPGPQPVPPGDAVRVGLVDGGVAARAPALAADHVIQRGFAAGGVRPSAHGTAVASLIAGRQGVFRGAAPGAWLYVADVYGATPAGGSAEAIVRALAWLARSDVPVINISLVGPPNLILGAAVKNLIARGRLLVAAVGNDGPAAPPLYPASYPGVVAVTAVDPHWRLLPEASRATHVDFAAPGSDMAAAGENGQFVAVRGTSFAAPIAAGLLAELARRPDRAEAQRAVSLLGHRALDLGPPGPDKLFGHGLVGNEFRVAPGEVRARTVLTGP